MSQTELRKLLASLRTDLNRTPELDTESRTLLLQLLIDIDRLLNRPTAVGMKDQSPPGQFHKFQEIAAGFEAQHPTLAATMHELVDTLTRMGM